MFDILGKRMRKNSFVEGTFIAYGAIVISKLMGALYSIPFYQMIGDQGGVIYSCAYSIYVLFLDISTSGVPIAVSIVISEYNARGMYRSKERAYSVALRVVMGLSLVSFLVMELFARQIGRYFLEDMTGGVSIEDIAAGVRMVAVCLLIAPLLSIKRGYLQGHKFLSAPSQSQVIEQLVRIAVVLAGTYLSIYVLKLGVTVGVCVALSGTALGALAAYLYLARKSRASREAFSAGASSPEERPAATGEIIRKVFSYCVTIVIMTVSISVYSLVDMKMLLVGLHRLHYSDGDTQVIASIASTWIPKICMIITALSTGLVSSIAPHMAESRSNGNRGEINQKLNQALSTVMLISVPLGLGMMIFAEPLFTLFYGQSAYGPGILRLAIVVNVVGSMATVTSMSMQSIGRGRTVCYVTIVGIILNAALDLPLIYLFHYLGLPAYLGATAASIVGQAVTLGLLLLSLRASYGFSYTPVLRGLVRELPAMGAMGAVALLLRWLWPPVTAQGLFLVVQLAVYALTGGGLYLLLAYRLGAVDAVLGRETTERLLRKFKVGRKEK